MDNLTLPKQGRFLHHQVQVVLIPGGNPVEGQITRDDVETPFLTIIHLADGRDVQSGEYHMFDPGPSSSAWDFSGL